VRNETDLHIMHEFSADTSYTKTANSRNLDVQIHILRCHILSDSTTLPKLILTSLHQETRTSADTGVPFRYTRQLLAEKTHLYEPTILLYWLRNTEHRR
jgi:hypothetical protein